MTGASDGESARLLCRMNRTKTQQLFKKMVFLERRGTLERLNERYTKEVQYASPVSLSFQEAPFCPLLAVGLQVDS